MWWVNRALGAGASPYHFATVYAPDGATNYIHSLNPIETFLVLPVQWLLGPLGAYNVACWLALVLTAFAAYLLARDVTGSRPAAFVGGFAIGFAPHQLAQLLGHMDVASVQFMVFGAWCLYRAAFCRGRTALMWSLWAAACVAACALSHPYTLIICLIVLVLMSVYFWWLRSGVYARQALWNGIVAVGVGLLVVSPLLLAMVRETAGKDAPGQGESLPSEVYTYSADLVAYVIPSPFHPLWGEQATTALRPLKGTLIEKVVYPGYVVLGLAILGLVLTSRARRQIALWLTVGLVGLVLSLGPQLQVGGNTTAPLPGALFYGLPGSSILRVPARFSVLLLLGLSVLATMGLASLLARLQARHTAQIWLLAGVTALLAFELLPAPFRTAPFEPDPWYSSVAGEVPDRSAAVLEVPFDRLDARPLATQMLSGLPLVGGYLSRQPVYALSRGVPPFAQFGLNKLPGAPLPEYGSICTPTLSDEALRDIVRLAGVRYVVLHHDRLDTGDPRYDLAARLFGAPLESATMAIYDTGGLPARDGLLGIAEDTDDWGALEGGEARWTGRNRARFHLWSGSQRAVMLKLTLSTYAIERDVTVSAGDSPPIKAKVGPAPAELALEWRAARGFSTVAVDISGAPLSPKSLGQGEDPRELTLRLTGCRLEER